MLSLDPSASSLPIENALQGTAAAQVSVLRQLSTGSRINSGADDAAGLSISDGLDAGVAALNQSAQNVTDGLGLAQTADGALSAITALLMRGVTLATEAANGTANGTQDGAADREFQALLAEVNNVAAGTAYNGEAVFQLAYGVASRTIDDGSYIDQGDTIYGNGEQALAPLTIFTSDGTVEGSSAFVYEPPSVDARALGLTSDHAQTVTGASQNFAANLTLLTPAESQQTLIRLTAAVGEVAAARDALGALVEQLQAASLVDTTQAQNLQNASSAIRSADIGATIGQETRLSVLQQTGIFALRQSQEQAKRILELLSR